MKSACVYGKGAHVKIKRFWDRLFEGAFPIPTGKPFIDLSGPVPALYVAFVQDMRCTPRETSAQRATGKEPSRLIHL